MELNPQLVDYSKDLLSKDQISITFLNVSTLGDKLLGNKAVYKPYPPYLHSLDSGPEDPSEALLEMRNLISNSHPLLQRECTHLGWCPICKYRRVTSNKDVINKYDAKDGKHHNSLESPSLGLVILATKGPPVIHAFSLLVANISISTRVGGSRFIRCLLNIDTLTRG